MNEDYEMFDIIVIVLKNNGAKPVLLYQIAFD